MEVAQLTVFALSVVSLGGGLVGFFKGKSKASLVAGVVSGLVLGLCGWLSQSNAKLGLALADAIIIGLQGVFFIRLKKTGKFMPSGMLLLLYTAGLILVTHALIRG